MGGSSTELSSMRRILARGDAEDLDDADRESLLAGHLALADREALEALEMRTKALGSAARLAEGRDRSRIGAEALRGAASLWPGTTDLIKGVELPNCSDLASPTFDIESPASEVQNETGDVIRSTRADASQLVLEVAAATGEFGVGRWPSSESFILGFNRSQASIGGLLSIPDHAEGAALTVTVELAVEQLVFGGDVLLGTAASLLATYSGDGDLPLRGTAVAWCRTGLSIHGNEGSARTGVEFVSSWQNRDGAKTHDRAPGGIVELTLVAALGPSTSAVSVFVDVSCFAGAEETEEPESYSAFALFECRDKPVTEINGSWVPPSRLRVRRTSARICQLPVLVQVRSRSEAGP